MRFPTPKQWPALFAATAFAALLTAQDPKTDQERPQQPQSDQGAHPQDPRSGQSGQTADRATTSGTTTLTQAEQEFVREAAADGHKEIESGKIAQKNASSKEVKNFGQKLVKDHSQANNKLQALARKKGMELPDYPTPGIQTTRPGAASDTPHGTPSATQTESGTTPTTSGTPQSTETAEQRKGSRPGAAGAPSTNPHEGSADRAGHMHGSELTSLTGEAFDRRFLEMMVDDHQKAVEKFESMQSKVTDSDLRKFISNTLPTLRQHLQTAKSLQSKTSSTSRSN